LLRIETINPAIQNLFTHHFRPMLRFPHSRKPTTRQRSERRHRGGATAVEFAIVAPVFMIVIAVCVDFSRLSMMRNLSQNAAYEAARFVMAEGATVADGVARANQILARVGTTGANVLITGSDGTSNGTVTNEITFDTQVINCTITIPLAKNVLVIPSAIIGNTQITSTISIRTERYQGFFDAEQL